MAQEKNYTWTQKLAAWAVHAFTASGIIAGFWAIVSIAEHNFFMAFMMLFLALIIDGIDGTFARMARVTEVLPHMSGKTMDYVIDFATYAIIPAYLIYAATQDGTTIANGGQYLLPPSLRLVAATIILLVSTLYYGKEGMVSNDYYFIGFPVLWNMVAFYLYYVWQWSPMGNFLAIIFFAILHFVPIKFLYPSRTPRFRLANILVTVCFLSSNITLLLLIETQSTNDILIIAMRSLSILTLIYFGAIAIYNTFFDKNTFKN